MKNKSNREKTKCIEIFRVMEREQMEKWRDLRRRCNNGGLHVISVSGRGLDITMNQN